MLLLLIELRIYLFILHYDASLFVAIAVVLLLVWANRAFFSLLSPACTILTKLLPLVLSTIVLCSITVVVM